MQNLVGPALINEKIFMKYTNFFAVCLAVGLLANKSAWGAELSSKILCEIQEKHSAKIVDGKTHMDGLFMGSESPRDKVLVTLSYIDSISQYVSDYIRVELVNLRNSITINSYHIDPPFILEDENKIIKLTDFGLAEYIFSRDNIKNVDAVSRFVLTRYYKDDYHGYYVEDFSGDLQTKVLTFNCQGKVDLFAEIFAELRKQK